MNLKNRTPIINRGDLYYVSLDPVTGSEQGGLRPVLIVQSEKGNKTAPTVIVLPVTSQSKPVLPTHVNLFGACGLTDGSIVLAEQLRTIDRSRLGRYIGSVNSLQLSVVDIAVLKALGIPTAKPANPVKIKTLCYTCKQQYEAIDEYRVRRISGENDPKETCDFCNTRTGFEYEVERV